MIALIIILLVWIIPIIIIGLLLYAAMKKDESIEEFVEFNYLNDREFLLPFLMPIVNITFMCYIACVVGYNKCKHWRKK